MASNYKSREERRRQQQAGKSKKKKRTKAGTIFKRIFLTVFFLGLACFLSGIGLFAYYASSAPKLDDALLIDPVSSELYDKDGELFTVLAIENRDYIEYDQIPKLLEDAVLATEDSRFYKHNGLDIIRFAGAVLANITRGYGSEGASTLTQQVIKNSFLDPEKTLKRKAQEAWLAFQLERKYTKEEIFEMYVNKILMSGNIYGMETAAKYFYGRELKDLELHEIAQIAGMPQSPNRYNPFKNPENAEKRRNIVLSLMYKHKKITKEEMEKAKQIPVEQTLLSEDQRKGTPYKYDSFVDHVIHEVEKSGKYNVYSDGLKIYTTLDQNAQQYTEEMLNSNEIVAFPDDEFQAGIALIETGTGEIRALGGGRNQEVKRGFNYATDLKSRQLGSTVKPLLDYGPAIEHLKWSTGQRIVDEPYTYSDGTKINNHDNKSQGPMSIREALYKSRNIPALKAFQEVGPEKAKDFAANIGIHFKNMYESYSIGGGEGASPLELAGAYAAFGNNGIYTEPHAVVKIVLRDGETEIKTAPEAKSAMKDYTAYMVTDMLKDVLTKGTGKTANVPGLHIAGKTGTTNYTTKEKKEYNIQNGDVPDSWFAGYNTNYTAAIWTGYDKKATPIKSKDQKIAQQLFKNLFSHISQNIETRDFKMPKSVVEVPIEIGTDPPKKPSDYTPKDRISTELFVKGTEPTAVSETFETLEAPSNVTATFDEEREEITLEWSHPDEGDIEFEVSGTVDGTELPEIGRTSDTSIVFTSIERGSTYTFTVAAIDGDMQSDPASTSITIPLIEDDEGEEETDDETIEVPEGPPITRPEDEEEQNTGNDNEGNNGDQEDGSSNIEDTPSGETENNE
ncbi:penicillin-binding protein 1A [Bacillus chungangensis]|uniref:Penicillin-binding protein 1A n=1 Tax=Bacillus chungangensis TaxID=587633 RepID=A0ABT9WSR9_9BACI|nr:penicillin-binding protein 1A [Bacillus chungangensis]MDQ0176164.1 penicillin-binding protein 1A [Bacillus chungangensis]